MSGGFAKLGNAWRRLKSGLPLRGGVSPEVPNDLFQAHLAAYVFAARFAPGRRVLDLGCGTGYGSARLLAAGAVPVVGADPDERSLRYARRRFPGIRFVGVAAEGLPSDFGTFDLIVAANVLAHLASPESVLDRVKRHLDPSGTFLASVPPIVDERTMETHRASAAHASNLYLWDWESLLRRRFTELHLFRLSPPAGSSLDLASPAPSHLKAEAFSCEEIPLARLNDAGTLSAIFVCSQPR